MRVIEVEAGAGLLGHQGQVDLTVAGQQFSAGFSFSENASVLQLAVSNLNFSNGNGAISATEDGSVTVQGGTFTGNSAANGGAISVNTGPGNLTVTDATFTGNTATDAGGAIYTSEFAGNTTVTGSTFTRNKAGEIGGAIYNFFSVEVSDSRFNANQATDGGGIFNASIGGDNLTGVTMHGNSATQDGGGVYSTNCSLTLVNSHVSGNHAGNDGGGGESAARV